MQMELTVNAGINNQLGGNRIMKKVIIVSLACCALIAPLAIAKDQNGKSSKRTRASHFAFVTQQQPGVTITAPSTPTRVTSGAAAAYQPPGTLVVQQDGPGRYVLEGPGHVFNSKGEAIRTAIKPGTPVRVYYAADEAGKQTIDRVVVE
jgi:hypothetical protein